MVGSAPPVNLSAGTGLNLGEAAYNRVEVVYVNTEMVCLFFPFWGGGGGGWGEERRRNADCFLWWE